jgi:steroid 5-alpha reductase family enzyme
MASAIIHHLLAFWAVAVVLMLALWRWACRVHNAAWVDVGWSASFALGIVTWLVGDGGDRAPWPLAIMVVAWSLRLAIHLARDRVIGRVEEGRYVELRRRWGGAGSADRAFLWFFQAQALLAAVLSIALVVPFVATPIASPRGALRWIAVGLFVLAIVGESMADQQLAAWKRDPAHRGSVCDVGLWRYSRHPNYFFEWLIWVSYALYAMAYPWGAIAWLGPTLILASIWKVTGIPATEAQALRSRGDAYRRYQATTSAFVPWPPRRQDGS